MQSKAGLTLGHSVRYARSNTSEIRLEQSKSPHYDYNISQYLISLPVCLRRKHPLPVKTDLQSEDRFAELQPSDSTQILSSALLSNL